MVTNSVVETNSALSSSRNGLAPDRVVEVSIAVVTSIVLALTLAMFIATPLHANLSAWADSTLRPYGVPGAVYVIYAAAIIAVLLLGIMRHNVLRYFLYLSWALYLPPILSFSRFDLLSPVIDGGLVSPGAGLPPVLVLAAGLLLVSVTLAQGAVEEHRSLRKSYLRTRRRPGRSRRCDPGQPEVCGHGTCGLRPVDGPGLGRDDGSGIFRREPGTVRHLLVPPARRSRGRGHRIHSPFPAAAGAS